MVGCYIGDEDGITWPRRRTFGFSECEVFVCDLRTAVKLQSGIFFFLPHFIKR